MTRFTFLYEEGTTKVSYSFQNICCSEIIEHFKQFLLSYGFLETTVMSAMGGIVDEYEMMEQDRQENLARRNAKSSHPD